MTAPWASLTTPVTAAVVTPCAAVGLADSASARNAPIAHTKRDLFTCFIADSREMGYFKRPIIVPRCYDVYETKRPPGVSRTAFDPIACREIYLWGGSRGPLFPQFLRSVAQLVRFLDERLLLGRIFFQVRLRTQEQVLIDQRFHVVRLDLQRVIHRLDALLDVRLLLVLLQLEIAIGLVPVVGRDRVKRFGVIRLSRRAFLERLDRLVEVTLAVVVTGERHVDRRIVGLGPLGHDQHFFGFVV